MEDGADDAVAEEEDLGGVAEVVGRTLQQQDGRVEVLEVGRCLDLQSGLVLLLAARLVWNVKLAFMSLGRPVSLTTKRM